MAAVAAKGTFVADVVAAITVAGVAPCTMGTFGGNHISKHTEECSTGNYGNMEEIIGHGIYHSKAMWRDIITSESDMQSQRKAGQHSKERGGRGMKEKKGESLLPSNQEIDTNRLNLLSQHQEFLYRVHS